ncbi:MAG: hypothetical protein FWG07_01050 [Treponema sp.]|nr:hypothetical protein [Treponema sp.]
MRYFICTLDKINLGIPAERTERIIPVTRIQTAVFETENDNDNDNRKAFISLPLLFLQNDSVTPHAHTALSGELTSNSLCSPVTAPWPEGMHGVVLKANDGTETPKTVLLTPRIDIDLEIPEEDIHSLPEAFVGFFRYFKGVYFTEDRIILILNIKKLMEKYND